MVVSFAVQKWNWCGVAGFCSWRRRDRQAGVGQGLVDHVPVLGAGSRERGADPRARALNRSPLMDRIK